MCDQTEVAYLPKDIVWVKLSNVWWPAEVQDEGTLEEDVTAGLKKKPLAIVKFFDEDLYEFPKNLNQIYHYNCLRKDEFIKKGLDLWRAELSRDTPYSMKKFPQDVQVAEEKTGGNPDYIDDPKFLPEEKFDYREKFGLKPLKKIKERKVSISPLPKTPRRSTPSPKVTFSTPLSIPSTSRALGSERKTTSTHKKSRSLSTPPSILKDPLKIKKKEEKICSYFPCVFCTYSCKRINNAVSHIKSHLRGLVLPHPNVIPTKYESVFEENQKKHRKTTEPIKKVSAEKTPLKRKSSPELSSSSKKKKNDSIPKKEKNIASPSSPAISKDTQANTSLTNAATPKKRMKKLKVTKEKKIESAALEILKDWDDESNADDHDDMEVLPALEESSISEKGNESTTESLLPQNEGSECLIECPANPQNNSELNKTPEKSCFDFEDTDESLNLDQSLKFGQKLPRVINEKQSTGCRFKHDLKADTIEDDLAKDVEDFLESTSVPVLPEVPSVMVQGSEVDTQLEKGIETFPKKEETKFSMCQENDEPLQTENNSDIQPDVKIVGNSSPVENEPPNEVVLSMDIEENPIDEMECEIQADAVLMDEVKRSELIQNDDKTQSTLEEHPVDTSSVIEPSESPLDDKTIMEPITSTIEEISTLKGKSEEKPLNLDNLKTKKKSEISEIDSFEIPVPNVDNNSKTIKFDLPLLVSKNAIQEGKKLFPDTDIIKTSQDIETDVDPKSVPEDNILLIDNSTAKESIEEKTEILSESNSEDFTTNELEKVNIGSIDDLNLAVEVEHGNDTITLSDESFESPKKNDVTSETIEISNDVLEFSEVESDLKLDCINIQTESSFEINDQKPKSHLEPDTNLALPNKKKEKSLKKEILSPELSSDNIVLEKSINLVSESPYLKAKLDNNSKQIDPKLGLCGNKESSGSGLVRKKLENDNRLSKKRKIENDTIICKDICKKDIKEITSSVQGNDEKSNAFVPDEINIADIPLPDDDYPVNAKSSSKNKKSVDVDSPVTQLVNDLNAELQTKLSEDNEKKEPKNQMISPDQMTLDINSMPVVFENDEAKPIAEYCYGKSIPRHPNAEVIHIKLVPRGQEHLVTLKSNERISGKISIVLDPNFKPSHDLTRIPFPTINNEPLPASNNEPLPASNNEPITASKNESLPSNNQSSAGEQIQQSSSTSFAVPEKPGGKNVSTLKQGAHTVPFAGKIPMKSNLRVLQTPGQKVYLVPNGPVGTANVTVPSTQSSVSTGGCQTTRLVKSQIPEKSQKKNKLMTTVLNKSNPTIVTKSIPLSRNVLSRGTSQSLLPGKNQGSRVVTASKIPKSGQQSAVLMKPPNAPAPKVLKSSSAMKGNTLFAQPLPAIGQRIIVSPSGSGQQVERKVYAQKVKQSSPNILQKNVKKTIRQIPISSTQMAAKTTQPQTSEVVPVRSLSTIVQGETSQTTGEPVVLLTLDGHGNCVPANQILPIVTNERRGLLGSGSLINIEPASSSGNIDNFLLTSYIKIGTTNTSGSSNLKKSVTQDILAEALANTQVLQTDTSELSEVDSSVYQQYPTTSLASNVLETSLTLNQPPIMSPLEVPSSVKTQTHKIKGKNSEINPSMPLLTDDILSDASSGNLTFQLVSDNQIVVASSGDVLTDASNQIMFASDVLPGQKKSTSDEVASHADSRPTKEDNILPDFFRGDFNKKSQNLKNS